MLRRRSFEGARCLVTGASSGLGQAIAEHLVRAGAAVILTGRSLNSLESTARALVIGGARPEAVIAVDADLTEDEGRSKVIHVAADRFGALDLVVNAASVDATGHFDTHDPSVLRRVFEINVFALIEMTRAVLPLLRQGDRPSLVNLGSVVARRALPGRSEYSASKFAVAGFTESIRAEWSRFGIHVLLLNPGFTSTEFENNLVANTSRFSARLQQAMTADQVARQALLAIRRGRHEVTLTREGRLLLLLNRLAPRLVDRGFASFTRRVFQDVVLASPRPPEPQTRPIDRLPHPHFRLTMQKSPSQGD
jgi:short-subunit dehydrogenase